MLAIVLLTLLNMSETIPVRLDQPLEIAFFPSFTLELIVLVIPFQRFKASVFDTVPNSADPRRYTIPNTLNGTFSCVYSIAYTTSHAIPDI